MARGFGIDREYTMMKMQHWISDSAQAIFMNCNLAMNC